MSKTRLVIPLIMVLSILSRPVQPSGQAKEVAPSKPMRAIITQIDLLSRDLIYDPTRDKIYASVPSSAGSSGNSIVSIDVKTAALGVPIYAGNEPNKLALSDDGQYLYVGLDGDGAIRRVNLNTQTAEIQFTLGSSSLCGKFTAQDMLVLKDNPNAVVVTRRNTDCIPHHEGIVVYDDGIERPVKTPSFSGSNVIEPSNSASILYGYDNASTEFAFRVMVVSSSGISVTSKTSAMIIATDIRFDNGLIYSNYGAVVEPDTPQLLGAFTAKGLVYPDSEAGRVYFLCPSSSGLTQFKIFNPATFTLTTSLSLPGTYEKPGSFIKVGPDLFAFHTTTGQTFLLKLAEWEHSIYMPLVHNRE